MNEIIVLVASYHLFCFTEWVYDLNVRFQVGWSMLVFLVINVATNITIIPAPTFMASLSFKPSSSAFCHGVSVDGKMNRIITFIGNVKYNIDTEIHEK